MRERLARLARRWSHVTGSRRTSRITSWTRIIHYAGLYLLLVPWVPVLHTPRGIAWLVGSEAYAWAVLASVRWLRREWLAGWIAASAFCDMLTVACLQYVTAPTAYAQVLYPYFIVYYALALGRAAWPVAAFGSGLMFGVDGLSGHPLVALDMGVLATAALTVFAVGQVSEERDALYRHIDRLASTDELTGLYNQRHFVRTFYRAVRATGTDVLTLALLDADGFKDINDRYGHAVGDRVLKACGQALAASLRASDLAFRYGGDELAVLLPHTPMEQARPVVDRAVEAMVAAARALLPELDTFGFSYGLADTRSAADPDQLFALADDRLYRLKHARETERRRRAHASPDGPHPRNPAKI
ncbi:MAG: GGDEF domain-containing protein [Actinomycetia bacterium]|nr:GGDEF domain-containing protein [Actinomycetes bacterium]